MGETLSLRPGRVWARGDQPGCCGGAVGTVTVAHSSRKFHTVFLLVALMVVQVDGEGGDGCCGGCGDFADRHEYLGTNHDDDAVFSFSAVMIIARSIIIDDGSSH